MGTIVAKKGQSLMDIAMEHCGDAGLWHQVGKDNGKADTWVADGGEVLEVSATDGAGTVAMLEREGVKPCTGGHGMVDGVGYEMVGEMMIG